MAVRAAEGTATTDDLAALFQVTDRHIRELARRGLVLKEGRGRYDLMGSVTRYIVHLREQAAGRMGSDESLDPVAEGALLKRSQRELNELKKAEIEGRVIPLERIGPAWARVANATRSSVLAIPGKARSHLPHLTVHDGETIDLLCRDALENAGAVLNAPEIGSAVESDEAGEDVDDESDTDAAE